MSHSQYLSNAPVLDSFLKLDQKGSIIAEYVWIDSSNGTRSKCKTILPKQAAEIKKKIEERKAKEESGNAETGPKKAKEAPACADGLSEWNFDGSSTGQADGKNSDVYLIPVASYPNPFLGGDNLLVMCETWHLDEKTGKRYPNKYNHRHSADVLLSIHANKKYWFGLEQEYTMKDANNYPYGWPAGGFPAPQGPYYCGNGTGKVFGRDIADCHYKACLYAGIEISGTNAEVMPGQMEFQVGPSKGIELGDQLWIARFLLSRVAEKFGVIIDLHPKPIPGDWNGAGLHSNVSTEAMRKDGGYKDIEECMAKLEKRHEAHMEVYGEDNASRMTGQHETASFDKFSWGVANRGSSVRINRAVKDEGKGYFEDRRPASNADPYQVTGIIVETLEGGVEGIDILQEHKDSKTQVNVMEIVQSRP